MNLIDKFLNKFCLISSEDSIANNKISLLAIFEIFISVWLYWYIIPTYFDTHYHIFFALLIAPFFLLRTDDSEKEALDLLNNFIYNTAQNTVKYIITLLLVLITLFLVYCSISCLAIYWLSEYEGFDLFWRSFIVGAGIGGAGIGIGGVVLVVTKGLEGIVGKIIGGAIGVVIIGVGLLAGGGEIGVAVGMAVVIGTGGLGTGIGAVIGIGAVSFLIKITIGLKYFFQGIKNISYNLGKINLSQDLFSTPEILVGINKYDGLEAFKFGTKIFVSDINATTISIMMKLLSIPAIIYRISLKSTAFIYLILTMIIPYFVNTKLSNQYMADRLTNIFWVSVSIMVILVSFNNFIDIPYISKISDIIHKYETSIHITYLFLASSICSLLLYPFGFYLKEEAVIKRYIVNFIRYFQLLFLFLAIVTSVIFIINHYYENETIISIVSYMEKTFLRSVQDGVDIIQNITNIKSD